ncbi:hypothetical protein IWX64_001117 [Arthrobacter sp. CAN_A212]|uniref:type II toxin-antitoxin system PemK/MazF family toxin n=1 Tax=unclassified Arthrobacter TaxID=235627 RepID=UPI0018CAFBEB|nr:type II toxin-antitoxin system PemK/MazF family toxin [Arthrobacter sp. CAN_C5]MBP2216581.1 hypothetical protein [Arthrobacter sp. CAN_C5]
MPFDASSLLRFARRAVRALQAPPRQTKPHRTPSSYAGDFTGTPTISYAPRPDNRPDAGEIVWAWVPYQEDHRQGKDRPVLLIGKHGKKLLGLMLTSRDRNSAHGSDPAYVDIGAGPWDRKGRPSEVRTDRIIQLAPDDVRRIGAVLPPAAFDRVVARLH